VLKQIAHCHVRFPWADSEWYIPFEEVEMNSGGPSSARVLMELAGLQLPAEREAAVTAGLQGNTQRIAEALARRDYGETEPAARFLPPPSRPA